MSSDPAIPADATPMMDEEYCRLCAARAPPYRLRSFTGADSDALFAALRRLRAGVHRADGLPQAACLDCVRLLDAVTLFLRRVAAAQIALAKIFQINQPSVKQEKLYSSSEPLTQFSDSESSEPLDNRIDLILLKSSTIGTEMKPIGESFKELEASGESTNHTLLSINRKSTLKRSRPQTKNKNKEIESFNSFILPVHSIISTETENILTKPNTAMLPSYHNMPTTTIDSVTPINPDDTLMHRWSDYFFCKRCDQRTQSLQDMREHSWKIHKRCVLFKCTTCTGQVGTFKRFLRHMTNHHSSLAQCCEFCNKCFVSYGDVGFHKMMEHTEEAKPHRCTACGTGFDSPVALQNHRDEYVIVKAKKASGRRFKCEQCDKDFTNLITLASHLEAHDVNKNVCTLCDKRYKNKYNLKQHVSSAHDPRTQFICQICGKSFKREGLLREHIAIHKGIKPHPCTFCDKKFAKKSAQKAHEAKHTGVRQHVCNICEKTYKFRSGLKLHLRIHNNIKPYSCDICVKSFFNWSNYNKHMKRIHDTDMSRRTIVERS